MDSMNARLRGLALGKSKRKSSTNISTQPSSSPPPNGAVHTPTGSNASTTSLPMNQSPAQNGLGRPPSYTYNHNAPRSSSPMPPGQQQAAHHPPPLNTNSYSHGHPAPGGAPQLPIPPGYGGGYQQPNGMGGGGAPGPGLGQYGSRGAPVEVEGAGKSKAQLIVGIDFVSTPGTCSDIMVTNAPNREQPSPESHSLLPQTQKQRRISLPNGQAQGIRRSKR